MKNLKPLQRLAITVAATSAAMTGIAGFAIITQPASTSAPDMTREVTYLDPAADEATTSTRVPAEVAEVADRAEDAADRAEVAAGRAEVAVTKVETIVTATTTPTGPAPSTTITTGKPILVGTIIPVETTTTTAAKPKQWVEIARVPANVVGYQAPSSTPSEASPLQFPVTLETGQLRVTMPQRGACSSASRRVTLAAWFGADSEPQAGDGTAENPGTYLSVFVPGGPTPPIWSGPWPTGEQTISIGQNLEMNATYSGWRAPWCVAYTDLVIEEYR